MKFLSPMTARDGIAYSLVLIEHTVSLLRAPKLPNGRAPLAPDAVERAFAVADAFIDHSTSNWAREEEKQTRPRRKA